MALFKHLSEGIWSYLSPRKPDATKKATTQNATPQTAPPARKRGRPPGPRKASVGEVVRRTKSMSPRERVDSWRAQSIGTESSAAGRKRKSLMTPSTLSGRPSKAGRFEVKPSTIPTEDKEDGQDSTDDESVSEQSEDELEEEDEAELEEEDEEEDLEDEEDDPDLEEQYDEGDEDNIPITRSSTPADHASAYSSNFEGDTSLLVTTHDYESPTRKKIISPTKEAFDRGISETELREQGWDDDHITLVQKIAMRGYEPLLPNHYKMEWPFMPDALFADDDDAVLSPVRGKFFKGSKSLERLFELGGRVRDRVLLAGHVTPEQETRKMVQEYVKWAQVDSGLDAKTAIPLLAIECQPASVQASRLQEKAREKLEGLAERYRKEFEVKQSIERSPSRRAKVVLSRPVPTLYGIIASGTLIALVAYNPADEEPDVKSIAFFQMRDKAYDVWNALALAIVICHVRNVQIRLAEETGLGLKAADEVKVKIDDPDR